MGLMSLGVVGTSFKDNEHRAPIHPGQIGAIRNLKPENIMVSPEKDNCEVDRTQLVPEPGEKRPGKKPVCQTWRQAWVGSHFAHFGEEDCLRGSRGSGTIFFSWCNLKCVFCQNCDFSQDGAGRPVSPPQLAPEPPRISSSSGGASTPW
jgi:uncharacterized Fe-S radical SAM superfamily protein PflX